MMNEHSSRFEKLGFQPKGSRNQQKVKCNGGDKCGNTDAKNKSDTCVSINLLDGIFKCHKCGVSGTVADQRSGSTPRHDNPIRAAYTRPKRSGLHKADDALNLWFENRGISAEIVKSNKIAYQNDWIVFPYIRNGELINVKRRHREKKDFRQNAGSMAIMWNHDRCVEPDTLIVVEGEIDGMSLEMAGFTNHTTPNQGAPNAGDLNVDKKLECISNTWGIFETKTRIIIAVDNDENGRRLESELIRRFGSERCAIVDWDDCKDANEYLLKHGAAAVAEKINTAVDVPVSGVWRVGDAWDSMLDGFRNGKKRGQTTHVPSIDPCWTWRTGDLNLWTGYNNEGKTAMLNQLLLLRAKHDGEKVGVFSPENYPADEFFDDLIHSYVGKTTDPYYQDQMNESEYIAASEFINDHFFVVNPESEPTLDVLFDKFEHLVRRHGIRHIVFDPWNQIDHDMRSGEREDLYISRVMTKFKRFAVDNDVSMNIVAHQNTPRETDKAGNYYQPTKYNLKGGGTFSDKADNVLIVWRPNFKTNKADSLVLFISDKIKKQRLVGHPSQTPLKFDRRMNQYMVNGQSIIDSAPPPKQLSMITPNLSFTDDDYTKDPPADDMPF
jgi:twinkle protein